MKHVNLFLVMLLACPAMMYGQLKVLPGGVGCKIFGVFLKKIRSNFVVDALRVGCKKYANDAKKCSFLNYPVRDRMLVDVNKFVREERAVRYATFSRYILSLAGQQRWRWVKFFTNILSLFLERNFQKTNLRFFTSHPKGSMKSITS